MKVTYIAIRPREKLIMLPAETRVRGEGDGWEGERGNSTALYWAHDITQVKLNLKVYDLFDNNYDLTLTLFLSFFFVNQTAPK